MNDTIGQRISALRKELGLSQEALGERLGVSRQAVNKWESDAAIPEIDKLIGLSRLFGVRIGWLLGVEEDAPQQDAAAEDPALLRIEALLKNQSAQPKWQKPLLIATALCAAVSLGLSLFALNQKSAREDQLEDMVIAAVNSIGAQGEPVTEPILTTSILKDSYIRVSPWENYDGADLTFTLTPDGYTEGQIAAVEVRTGGKHLRTVQCEYDRGFWVAEVSLDGAAGYEYYFLLTHPDGTQQLETIRAGVLSDLQEQLDYFVSVAYGTVSTRKGYFSVHSLALNVYLPPVLENTSPAPKWEQLDLVFYRNEEEIYRKDYTYLCDSGNLTHAGSGLSAPVSELNPGDQIKLNIQVKAENVPVFDEMLYAWQISEDGTLQEIFARGN